MRGSEVNWNTAHRGTSSYMASLAIGEKLSGGMRKRPFVARLIQKENGSLASVRRKLAERQRLGRGFSGSVR